MREVDLTQLEARPGFRRAIPRPRGDIHKTPKRRFVGGLDAEQSREKLPRASHIPAEERQLARLPVFFGGKVFVSGLEIAARQLLVALKLGFRLAHGWGAAGRRGHLFTLGRRGDRRRELAFDGA